MRTTLTLDEDVWEELKRLARETGTPLKEVVNSTLRTGLQTRGTPRPRRYRLTPASLGGVVPGVDLDRALQLDGSLEDEAIARKLELHK